MLLLELEAQGVLLGKIDSVHLIFDPMHARVEDFGGSQPHIDSAVRRLLMQRRQLLWLVLLASAIVACRGERIDHPSDLPLYSSPSDTAQKK